MSIKQTVMSLLGCVMAVQAAAQTAPAPIAPLPSDGTAAPQGHIVRRGNRFGGMQ